jgi:intein/homing endonuclease
MAITKKIQIKDLAVGMKIKTLDENRNIVFKTVTDKWDTVVSEHDQVRVEFENGTVVNCSINHPFMIWDNGPKQKKPLELTSDDRVLTERGFTRLLSCDVGQKNSINYIDITVEDTHTFFAANDERDQMVLTHNSQGGIRNASCTVYLPVWHYQFEDFIVLKNNQGTEETRVRQLDYGVVVSKLFWRRYKNGENITLFDPHEVPDLYEAYYRNVERFEELYVKYESDSTKKKKVLSAEEIFKNGILKERTDTGRIYMVNIDNVINQGPFNTEEDPIYMSNLCAEILLPTRPFQRLEDESGRISLCTLGSQNWGAFRNPQDMRKSCRTLVRSLSNLLSYQDFLSVQSKLANQDFEPLGIGITNLAYWHAKRGLKYGTPEALAEVKRWMEHQAYYLTEASIELAEERGACGRSEHTWYGRGVFPWERRAQGVNDLTDFTPSLDWESLRTRMLKSGIRNAVLMAIAPVESCHSWEDKINTLDGTLPNFHELCEKAGLNWELIESTNLIGHHEIDEISVVGPDGNADSITSIYYNGMASVNEIIFEDGSIVKLTDNHRLLVNRDNEKKWIHVRELSEGDDVVEVNDFGETEIPA